MKTIPFVLVLILLLLGVHVLNKPLSLPYEVIGDTVLGHEVRIDKEGDSSPYIVVQTGMYSTRYTPQGYVKVHMLKPSAIRCWN